MRTGRFFRNERFFWTGRIDKLWEKKKKTENIVTRSARLSLRLKIVKLEFLKFCNKKNRQDRTLNYLSKNSSKYNLRFFCQNLRQITILEFLLKNSSNLTKHCEASGRPPKSSIWFRMHFHSFAL